jgi:ABC-type uncharacterized transport system substrate-binding protein
MVALAFFVACKDSKSTSIKIGISKIVSHPALDSVEKGIQDELKEEGFTNITMISRMPMESYHRCFNCSKIQSRQG